MKSSYYYNLFEILKNKGFEVERNLLKSLTLERAEQKEIKKEMKENAEELVKKYFNNDLDDNHRTKIKLDRIMKDLDIPKSEQLINSINKNDENILDLTIYAGCGLSTRGQWRGPVKCNEWEGEFGQCLAPYTTMMCRFVPTFIMTFMTFIAIMCPKMN